MGLIGETDLPIVLSEISEKGLARRVGEEVKASVTFCSSRVRHVSGTLVENEMITYPGQTRFAVQPRKGRKVNLHSSSAVIGVYRRSNGKLTSDMTFYHYFTNKAKYSPTIV